MTGMFIMIAYHIPSRLSGDIVIARNDPSNILQVLFYFINTIFLISLDNFY